MQQIYEKKMRKKLHKTKYGWKLRKFESRAAEFPLRLDWQLGALSYYKV